MSDRRLICALDLPTADEARALTDRLGEAVTFYKVGLQLFATDGMALARDLKADGKQVFLDWKLHDIGATVEKAAAALAGSGCDLLTVHARPQVMALLIQFERDLAFEYDAIVDRVGAMETGMVSLEKLAKPGQAFAPGWRHSAPIGRRS